MDLVQDNSPQDNHVALNAADGTKSQELTYSYQNGLHTFSIPLKGNEMKQKDELSSNKSLLTSANQHNKTERNNVPVDYHLVEAVSFELAPTGFSKGGDSQEYTLVPTGSKPFGFENQAEEKSLHLSVSNADALRDVISNSKTHEGKRKRANKETEGAAKKHKPVLAKSKRRDASEAVTELGVAYKKSRAFENVDSNEIPLSSSLDKPKVSTNKKKDILQLPCEWNQCSAEFEDLTLFMVHVKEHIKEVPILDGQKGGLLHGNQSIQKQIRNRRRGRNVDLSSIHDVDIIDEDDEEEEEERLMEESDLSVTCDEDRFYCCLWRSCGYISQSKDEITRHINFHTFHTKLKFHGASVWKETGIEPCSIGTHQRNVIPELSEPLFCQWEGCSRMVPNEASDENDAMEKENQFCEPLKFYWHVAWHSEEMRDTGKKDTNDGKQSKHKMIPCRWKDCTSKVGTVSKLKDHLRVHSQERAVACPVCGGLFTNRSKFYDHCKRQAPESLQNFKCSYCNKKFATERLLRDHMRAHVNHYKCPLCEMTCPVPSALAQHMAYRHFQVKSFGCEYEGCQYRAKTNADLRNHLRIHLPQDSPDAFYHCDVVECDFKAKAKATVKQHKIDAHNEYVKDAQVKADKSQKNNLYVCHMCDKAFARGAYLTQHFLRIHKFRWPSGHSRFRYKKDERTGQFHLQTIRFESAELHNNPTTNQHGDEDDEEGDEDSLLLEQEENTKSSHIDGDNDLMVGTEESNSNSNDNIDEGSTYLTFGNIFANKSKKNTSQNNGENKLTNDRNNVVGGLDAIIAAASVLDGGKHVNS